MLSRRSIRVKVMQVLYALSKDESLTLSDGKKMYYDYIDRTYDLFLYNLYVLLQVTKESKEDAEKRKSKHLPTAEDKIFTDKLYNNELVKSVLLNPLIVKEFEKRSFRAALDADQVKKIYNHFSKEDAYSSFLKKTSSNEDIIEILLELFRFCRQSDLFKELIEEKYVNWVDDKSMAIGTVKKVIKSMPIDAVHELKDYYPEDEITEEYGAKLLDGVMENDAELLELIKPTLKNWDSERLATIDIILIKMAVYEMKTFETIPTKVTLNEYVEVAKQYSTDKSKEFVNGVLDKLMKQLEANGEIVKKGRGLTK